MKQDERTKPLQEWNRLARENTENAIVSSMFVSTLRVSNSIDVFNNWMLVATAAIASFLIINVSGIIDFIGREGVVDGGYILCLSCLLGLFGKIAGLRCKVGLELSEAVKETFTEHLTQYKSEEEKIQQGAKFWGISLETGVRIERILKEYLAPFPKPVRWLADRSLKKQKQNPQLPYVKQVTSFMIQSTTVVFQALFFILFFVEMFMSIAKL
ncbi:hypothetical protein CXF86_04725 [Shewanella sp. GutCb]|uniref:hypothetical protein n=1 Tax=Shewanella sp. GutCb TaxID=2058315 RepID=UPI000C7E5B59|nr:hypothetical protein [Shewanella sp. GutCb]PKG76214.1 hypothetical protein CXF86_04725 [Shewanella sp. GutCb]